MLSKGSRPSEKPHAGKDVVSPSVTLKEAGIDGKLADCAMSHGFADLRRKRPAMLGIRMQH